MNLEIVAGVRATGGSWQGLYCESLRKMRLDVQRMDEFVKVISVVL